eukprot:TRINITY_DN10285_c0_g1_i1.p5 TRINITY_DN10285_c0_g1~~TRINITY_DN10285_c0_g1_i1.p5  ORF type:complete len:106 (+),score=10.66 TRINITY_DN10285_c0_g1_i1:94-411(+)
MPSAYRSYINIHPYFFLPPYASGEHRKQTKPEEYLLIKPYFAWSSKTWLFPFPSPHQPSCWDDFLQSLRRVLGNERIRKFQYANFQNQDDNDARRRLADYCAVLE